MLELTPGSASREGSEEARALLADPEITVEDEARRLGVGPSTLPLVPLFARGTPDSARGKKLIICQISVNKFFNKNYLKAKILCQGVFHVVWRGKLMPEI